MFAADGLRAFAQGAGKAAKLAGQATRHLAWYLHYQVHHTARHQPTAPRRGRHRR